MNSQTAHTISVNCQGCPHSHRTVLAELPLHHQAGSQPHFLNADVQGKVMEISGTGQEMGYRVFAQMELAPERNALLGFFSLES